MRGIEPCRGETPSLDRCVFFNNPRSRNADVKFIGLRQAPIALSLLAFSFSFNAALAQPGLSAPKAELSAEEEQTIAALPKVAPGLNRHIALAVKPSQTVSAVYTYIVRAPKLTATEWVMIAAVPPNLPGQHIVKSKTAPASTVVAALGPLHQPLFQARVPATEKLQKEIEFRVYVAARLYSRRLVPAQTAGRRAEVAELTQRQRKLALRPTSQFDYTSDGVKNWTARQKLHRRQKEGEVDYASRLYQVIAKNFKYEYIGEQDRSSSNVCTEGKSDCGGMCALFVSVLRSQGIPSRTLAGRWAESAKLDDRVGKVDYFQEHVKAEFYAQGVGWVPADLSSGVLHDRSSRKLRYFGNDPGDFIVFHIDTDVEFDSIHFGKKTMRLLQSPSYWATGSGSFDGVTIQEDWKVR
jgi:transglutaminase-like putative cysteine protease